MSHPVEPSPTPRQHDDEAPWDAAARSSLARRMVAFDHALHNRMATTVIRLPFGVARHTPDLSLVHSLSGVQLERPVAVAELETTFASVLPDVPNRRVFTTLAEVAWSLGPPLADRGWRLSRVAFMAHDGRTAPTMSPLGFSVVDASAYSAHGRPATAEEPWGRPPVVEEMMQRNERLADRVGARFVMSRDGMAGCHLYQQGTTAQIESVTVLTEARGQGLGDGLMAAAMQETAAADVIFLIADADDWPVGWYRRLGFIPLVSGWEWNREVTSTEGQRLS